MGETMSETEPATKAWKGLDKDFSCRGHAFAVGETYSIDGAPIVCERGFHACTSPLDVLAYYPFGSGARYAEVELLGATVAHHSDSKIAASSIRIVREITYADLWAAHRAWLQETLKEDEATGDSGHASATGDNGHASATGVGGHASATGVNAISVAIGISARAKASAGNWIVLARYTRDGELVEGKTAKIGVGGLKPDTWYRLDEDGGFVALDGGEETAR